MLFKNFKNILVPTDFSECAENALEYACSLANTVKAKIVLGHAYDVLVASELDVFSIDDDISLAKEEAKKRLDEVIAEYKHKYPDLILEKAVEQGPLNQAIAGIIYNQKIDAVVMGTKGINGINEYFAGSNTASVIENIEVPLLVVPSNLKYKPLKKIAFTTNFEYEDVEAIGQITKLAESYKAEVQVIHIVEDQKANLPVQDQKSNVSRDEEVMDWFREITEDKVSYPLISFKNMVSSENLLSEVEEIIEKENIDMIAMSTRGRTFLQKMFAIGFTRKMVHHTEIPLLVFHINEPNSLNE